MNSIQHVAKTALARQTRKIIRDVQHGQTVIVEHHGQPEVAIMDIMDYYLLRAALHYHAHDPQPGTGTGLDEAAVAALASQPEQVNLVMTYYLAGRISLSRAAELLDLPWLDLRTRCLRLEIPLRTAPETAEEIAADVNNAAAFTISSS